MIPIDIPSVLVLFVLISASVAVFFSIEAIRQKKKDSTTLMYIISKIFQALSVAVVLLPGYPENTTLIILHNLFYFTGFGGEIYVIISINTTRRRMHNSLLLIMIGVASLFNVLNVLTHSDSIYRIFFIGLFSFFQNVYFGIAMIKQPETGRMRRITGFVSFVFAIPWALRTYSILIQNTSTDLLHDNLFQTLAYIGNILFFTILPMLYLFIFKEKDQQKLKEQNYRIIAQNNEILKVNKELEDLNATKDEFFRIIGHDLKGPIGQMAQLVELFEKKYKDLTDQKLLNIVSLLKESSVISYKLLENLLDWARTQTGQISFLPTPVLLSTMITENIELIQHQAEAKKITIQFNSGYEGELLADRNMIDTVLRTLLSNAVKFSHKDGQIEVSSYLEKDKVFVSVKDNGVGMNPENTSKLFKIGSGYSTQGTNKEAGTGIGLILCKEFIDKHQGEIWVESEENVGSCFYFSIPLQQSEY